MPNMRVALFSPNYSVFALSDAIYPGFRKCSHDFCQRSAPLGANRLTPTVDCYVDFDGQFSNWIPQIEQALAA